MATNMEGVNPDFQARLNALVGASGGKIRINNAFRSDDEQAKLYANALKKYGSEHEARKWVAPPGKSNHGKGFAADLEGDMALAHRLAPQFGLHFPMGHEPWHVEPVAFKGSKDAYTIPPGSDLSTIDLENPDTLPNQDPAPLAEFAQLIGGLGMSSPSPLSAPTQLPDGISGIEQVTAGAK